MTILLRLCNAEGYMKFIFTDVIKAQLSANIFAGAGQVLSDNVGVIAN